MMYQKSSSFYCLCIMNVKLCWNKFSCDIKDYRYCCFEIEDGNLKSHCLFEFSNCFIVSSSGFTEIVIETGPFLYDYLSPRVDGVSGVRHLEPVMRSGGLLIKNNSNRRFNCFFFYLHKVSFVTPPPPSITLQIWLEILWSFKRHTFSFKFTVKCTHYPLCW